MVERELPVVLSKGANLALRELDEELGSLTVVLETAGTDAAVDADVSVLLLGGDGRVRSNDDMIFYNQEVALDGAIRLREKVRSRAADEEVVLETVTVDLDDVPDDVQRIVMAASLDPSMGVSFGAAAHVRMRIQRSADGQDLLQYDVSDVSDETALLFGEFYRRDGLWRVRAIGQGYSGGLAHLATDFGVEVAPATDETSVEDREAPADDRRDDSEAKTDGKPSGAVGRLSVRRPQRAPKMPAEWRKTIPADDAQDWTPARLFSVAGIGGAEEQEQRATSALLAVAGMVKEFGRALVLAMGGPAGVIETFTEVRFGQEEKMVRPDGVLRSSWGQREWTALIEVKTARPLSAAQIDSYVEVARAERYDAVVIISNGLSIGPDDYLVDVDRRKLRKVAVCHLGWDEIRALATACLEHRGVADSTQRRVLAEFLRYMDHPRSGTQGVTDMGPHWVKVRDSAKNKTLRPADRGAAEVIHRFDQLVKHVGLGLAGVLGVDVQTTLPGTSDTLSRSQQLSDSGVLFGAIRVPGAVDELVVCMDVARERVSCAVTVPAPRDGRPATRVTWLLRQLETAPDTLRVEAMLAGGRGQSLAENLKTVRSTPASILAKDSREIRAFRLTLELPTSSRDVGRGNVISVVETVTYRFYAEVVQHLQRWIAARPPKLPST